MRRGQRFREYSVGAAILVLVGVGLAVEATGDPFSREQPASTDQKLFVERALFCPSLVERMEGAAHLTTGPFGDEPLLIDIEPGGEGPRELTGDVLRRVFRQPSAMEVITYGGFAVASTATSFRKPVEGLAAANCGNSAASSWYFAGGSSAPGFNEFIVLYNPFPDEAVVRVQLVTPQGIRSKANLANVPIPSRGTTAIRVNEFVLQEPVVGAHIQALRGRFVAWKTVFAQPDGRPNGVGSVVGARETATEWFFPAGSVGSDADERITVLNPSNEEAVVSISLATEERSLQPDDLIEVEIPGRRVQEFSITKAVGRDVGGVSAVLRSDNGVGVIAERAVWYKSEGFNGYSLSLGAPKASASWWLGPAATAHERDSVIVFNVGQEEATVSVQLLTPTETEKVTIDDVKVPAGGRARIPLSDLVDQPAAAILSSSAPVVAERIAYSSSVRDVATMMGIPIE